ncbi:MAG: hypothetical protein RL132_269 [Pseudomonadota bacterium]
MLMVGVARVGNEPVARYTPDGKAVMDISLAFDYGRKGSDGRRPTQWVNAAMWGDRVERLQPYLSKGSQVFVTLSEPHIETYEKKDGSGQGFSMRARVTAMLASLSKSSPGELWRDTPITAAQRGSCCSCCNKACPIAPLLRRASFIQEGKPCRSTPIVVRGAGFRKTPFRNSPTRRSLTARNVTSQGLSSRSLPQDLPSREQVGTRRIFVTKAKSQQRLLQTQKAPPPRSAKNLQQVQRPRRQDPHR